MNADEGNNVELNDLTITIGEWLRGSGPQADIVMSTRIRLSAQPSPSFPLSAARQIKIAPISKSCSATAC